ncbi:MAG: hypothetical protein ACK50Q_13535 [Labrys sp. (in: a-proteobacteria)]|jgi:hypothetical protein
MVVQSVPRNVAPMLFEPFVVQTWLEEAGDLVPAETISFATIQQARSLAAFAARRRAGVTIYQTPEQPNGRRQVIATLGRVPVWPAN